MIRSVKAFRSIIDSDTDGASIVWIDYRAYHGTAIVSVDFDKRTFKYIDQVKGSGRVNTGRLDTLLQGMATGVYGLNYIEVTAPTKEPAAD